MNDIENRAREYIAEHSEYSEALGLTFVAVDTLTAMIEFSKQETKELEKENAELKEVIKYFNPCGEWNNDVHDCEFRHYTIEYGSKLTKAKELILKLSTCLEGHSNNNFEYELIKEAERFLNSESQSKWINPARTTNDNEIEIK